MNLQWSDLGWVLIFVGVVGVVFAYRRQSRRYESAKRRNREMENLLLAARSEFDALLEPDAPGTADELRRAFDELLRRFEAISDHPDYRMMIAPWYQEADSAVERRKSTPHA
jgi:hypothetical protein